MTNKSLDKFPATKVENVEKKDNQEYLIRSNNSLDQIFLGDKVKAEKLREKGPDIYTGNGYDSQIYRGRLDKRDKRNKWERFTRSSDTRKKLVDDMTNQFEDRFKNLREFAEKYPFDKVVGMNPLAFIENIKYDKKEFDKYKDKALKGTTTMKNQMFDRMLAHLDLFQSHERQVAEWKKQKGDTTISQESKARLDKSSLDKVYKALEDNYKAFYNVLQEKNNLLAGKSSKQSEELMNQIDQKVEKASRDWYRAFLIIEEQTHQNITEVSNTVRISKIGDPIRDQKRLQPIVDKLGGADRVVILPEAEYFQKGLEKFSIPEDQTQKLTLEYDLAKYHFLQNKRFLKDIVGLYGGELGKKDGEAEHTLDRIHDASRRVVESSRKAFELGAQIIQKASNDGIQQPSTSRVEESTKKINELFELLKLPDDDKMIVKEKPLPRNVHHIHKQINKLGTQINLKKLTNNQKQEVTGIFQDTASIIKKYYKDSEIALTLLQKQHDQLNEIFKQMPIDDIVNDISDQHRETPQKYDEIEITMINSPQNIQTGFKFRDPLKEIPESDLIKEGRGLEHAYLKKYFKTLCREIDKKWQAILPLESLTLMESYEIIENYNKIYQEIRSRVRSGTFASMGRGLRNKASSNKEKGEANKYLQYLREFSGHLNSLTSEVDLVPINPEHGGDREYMKWKYNYDMEEALNGGIKKLDSIDLITFAVKNGNGHEEELAKTLEKAEEDFKSALAESSHPDMNSRAFIRSNIVKAYTNFLWMKEYLHRVESIKDPNKVEQAKFLRSTKWEDIVKIYDEKSLSPSIDGYLLSSSDDDKNKRLKQGFEKRKTRIKKNMEKYGYTLPIESLDLKKQVYEDIKWIKSLERKSRESDSQER